MSTRSPPAPEERTLLGLFGATMVGVGAMVGAGIFVLCGVAMENAGPGSILAFVLNGALATLTAMSFAELASAFPESGGSYVFAKKVFPIGGAFVAGWVLWLAYIAACALYSLGFASFLVYALEGAFGLAMPPWFAPATGAATALLGLGILVVRGASAGNWISFAKVVAFLVLIVAGAVAFGGRPAGTLHAAVTPLLPFGLTGVLVAMGFTFIALEGFEVIAAIGEEVRRPERTIPRAMFLSIGITLVVYLGLLFVALTVGGPAGGPPAWRVLADAGEDAMAVAAQNFAGALGSVVVVVAGLLATFSALVASLMAASRVSFSMARDRALPRWLSTQGGSAHSPRAALLVSALLVVTLILATHEVEVTGAAASLIFLVSFGLTNAAGLLVRLRVGAVASWRAPFYPATPILGITACLGLAIFQAAVVPAASLVVVAWLLVGAGLYRAKFGARARTVSARAEAWDSDLIRLRGRTPLVLVPMANPERARPLLRFAWALATPGTGRVHALTVAPFDPERSTPEEGVVAYERAQAVVRHAVETACRLGKPYDGSILLAPDVTDAIARVAAERHPETVLLGMTNLDASGGGGLLEEILGRTAADVVVLHAPAGWTIDGVGRVLLPVAGGVRHDPLRARIVGMLLRGGVRRARLLRILRPGDDAVHAEREMRHQAEDLGVPIDDLVLETSTNPLEVVLRHSADADLLVLGSGPGGRRRTIGPFARRVCADAHCAVVAIAQAPGSVAGRVAVKRG
jgi:APA family basic amino acid/polyamine antiporter